MFYQLLGLIYTYMRVIYIIFYLRDRPEILENSWMSFDEGSPFFWALVPGEKKEFKISSKNGPKSIVGLCFIFEIPLGDKKTSFRLCKERFLRGPLLLFRARRFSEGKDPFFFFFFLVDTYGRGRLKQGVWRRHKPFCLSKWDGSPSSFKSGK